MALPVRQLKHPLFQASGRNDLYISLFEPVCFFVSAPKQASPHFPDGRHECLRTLTSPSSLIFHKQ
jgi:hypothetical protein